MAFQIAPITARVLLFGLGFTHSLLPCNVKLIEPKADQLVGDIEVRAEIVFSEGNIREVIASVSKLGSGKSEKDPKIYLSKSGVEWTGRFSSTVLGDLEDGPIILTVRAIQATSTCDVSLTSRLKVATPPLKGSTLNKKK